MNPEAISSFVAAMVLAMLQVASWWRHRQKNNEDDDETFESLRENNPSSVKALAGAIREMSKQQEQLYQRLDACLESRAELRREVRAEINSAIDGLRRELRGEHVNKSTGSRGSVSESQRREIQRLHKKGNMTQQAIADKVGCSRYAVRNVLVDAGLLATSRGRKSHESTRSGSAAA